MLTAARVVDCTTERGLLCARILADLGADVVAVEPPGGNPARRRGPFAGDVTDPERSLTWWAYARDKRSVVLDLDDDAGRAAFRRLVAGADFLVESYDPGWLAARGLDHGALAALNPSLVHVAITPFGQDGPKAHWQDADLVLLAAGGPLVLMGDDDRAPVRLPVPQAWLHAGAEAAVAALIAHHERVRSGRGQLVDVSAQQALTIAMQSYSLCAPLGAPEIHRSAGGHKNGPIVIRHLFPTRDGHVAITFLFGSAIGPFTRRLMTWIAEEGGCDAATRDKDWLRYTELLLSGAEPLAEFERVKAVVAAFTATRSKQDLLDAALARGLLIAPVSTTAEVLASPQLAARDYWQALHHDELGRDVPYPGAFARFPAAPLRWRRRAPRLGEHTAEVLAGPWPARPTPSAAPTLPGARALDGLKVLDFMWVMAGPAATRTLADHGATVVRIESTRRIDTARTLAPFFDGIPGAERSGCFQNLNAGKRMVTLDPTTPGGRAAALDLVRWADVVCESFSPGTLARWGLGWDVLRAANPGVILLSTCLMGQSGPLSRFVGYGNLAAAICGFSNLGGWPDRPPAGPFSAYTDYVAPRFVAIAILAALEHRRRTGEGQHVDLAQGEAALHFLAPALLDWSVNGRVAGRVGNADLHAVPHGVFPAAGDDRWVALAVDTDAAWRGLCAAMARPALADDPRFATPDARRAHAAALDATIAAWARTRSPHELETTLQAHGVAASAVQNSAELWRDPQLAHREHFVTVPHPERGTTVIEGVRVRLSRTPGRVEGEAPTYGRDTVPVLTEILGYDDARLAALAAAGALE